MFRTSRIESLASGRLEIAMQPTPHYDYCQRHTWWRLKGRQSADLSVKKDKAVAMAWSRSVVCLSVVVVVPRRSPPAPPPPRSPRQALESVVMTLGLNVADGVLVAILML